MTANCHKFASVFQWLNLDQWDVGRSSVYATSRPSPKNTAIWSGFLFFPPCRLEPGESKEGNGTPLQYSCLENPMDGIPWTEKPGRLWSMESLEVGHNWVTSLSLFTFMHWRRKWQSTPVFLPGESQGQGNLVGCCLWGLTESNTTEATKQQARTWKCSWTKYNQLNKDNSLQLGDQKNRSNYTLEFGEGNGTPLQYSCLENPMDGGA